MRKIEGELFECGHVIVPEYVYVYAKRSAGPAGPSWIYMDETDWFALYCLYQKQKEPTQSLKRMGFHPRRNKMGH